MKINRGKSKAVRFTRARVKNPLGSLGDQKIPETSSYKYLGIISRSDLNWVDQVNCTVKKGLEGTALSNACFKKKGNRNTKIFSLHVIGTSSS
jgi:hypothetical protein